MSGQATDVGAAVVADLAPAAEQVAAALRSSRYAADFSPASLWEVDRFLDEHVVDGAPRRGGLLAEQTGERLFALSAYVGEVVRRALGGTYAADAAGPARPHVALDLPDGTRLWPADRVLERLADATASIAAYGAAAGLEVGPRPARRRRGLLRRP